MNKYIIWGGGLLAAVLLVWVFFFRKKNQIDSENLGFSEISPDDWDKMQKEFALGNPYKEALFDDPKASTPETLQASLLRSENISGTPRHLSFLTVQESGPFGGQFSQNIADQMDDIYFVPDWHPNKGQKRQIVDKSAFENMVFSRIKALLKPESKEYTLSLLDQRFSLAGGLSRLPAKYIATPAAALAAQARAEISAAFVYDRNESTIDYSTDPQKDRAGV